MITSRTSDTPAARIRTALEARQRAASGRRRASAPVIVKQVEALREPAAVHRTLAYIARFEAGEAERLVDETGARITREEASAAASSWHETAQITGAAITGGPRRRSQVLARHFVFSLPVDADRMEARAATPAAARAFDALTDAALATFGTWGHRFVAAAHRDTDHPHLHILVDWFRPDGPLLPLDPSGAGLDGLRHAIAEAGRRSGFDVDGCRIADVESPEQLQRSPAIDGAEAAAVVGRIWARNRRSLAAALDQWNGHDPAGTAARLRQEADAVDPADNRVRGLPVEGSAERVAFPRFSHAPVWPGGRRDGPAGTLPHRLPPARILER